MVIGDALLPSKPCGTTRIYMQNVNGLQLGPLETFHSACEALKEIEVDHAMFCEHKLDTTKPRVHNLLHERAREVFGLKGCCLKAASSPVPFHGHWKPGGTMSLTTGPITGRLIETSADALGRWAWTKFRGRDNKVVTMICTYQVCQADARTTGPMTCASQLYSVYCQEGRQQAHRVRVHHLKDLSALIKKCQEDGELVLVTGDLNEEVGADAGGMSTLTSDYGLEDVMLHCHGPLEYATYNRGSRILDYCFADPALLPAIDHCGFEPFAQRIVSDHRGFFIDFDTTKLLGSDHVPLAKLESRDITAKKPHQIYPYFQAKHSHLNDHKWFKGIQELQQCYDTDSPNHALAEKLDERLTRSSLFAASKVKRCPKPLCSLKIVRLRNIDSCLRLLLRQFRSQVDLSEQIAESQSKLTNLDFQPPTSLAQCVEMQRQAYKDFKNAVLEERKNRPARNDHLRNLMSEAEANGDTAKVKKLKRLLHAELVATTFHKFARWRGKNKNGGLSHVLVPSDPHEVASHDCTAWKSVTDPSEIEQHLLERVQYHFGQGTGSTWTSGPLNTAYDFTGCDARADAILNGDFVPDPDLHPQAKKLIEHLAYATPESIDAVGWELTEEEFKGKIKHWDERKSTSAKSGVHLGHAKAYYASHDMDPDDDDSQDAIQELAQWRSSILMGHILLLNYAIKFGYVYKRWKVIVNSLIEKEPGNPRLHRLRTIHLYEWDWSLLLAVKWRKMIHHGFDRNLFNTSSYGGTPGRMATDAIFIKEMEYEISRLTRKPLIQYDNDAKSCYDRIPPYLGNVASRRFGISKKLSILHGKCLQSARYHIRTKLGITTDYASHDPPNNCFWGSGQGATNSPGTFFALICSAYDAYDSQAQGATFVSPDKAVQVVLYMLGFVDDNNSRHNLFCQHPPPTMEDLLEVAQQDAQLWHDLIVAINQELELRKCSYHAIHYEFSSSGAPKLVDSADPPGDLPIQGRDGNPVAIPYNQASKALRYLGCHKCPANQKKQKEYLSQICKDTARVLNCRNVTKTDANLYRLILYKPSVGYSLSTTWFSFKDLKNIQAPAHRAIAAASGYMRYTSHDIMFGPHHLGGAGHYHLYDLQGYSQLHTFFKFWRSPESDPGKMLRVAMAWAQFCVGTEQPLLTDTTTPLPHLEANWISSVRKYLQDMGGTLQLKDPMVPPLQRHHDAYIMDRIMALGSFTPAQIRKINYCRLYLNAVTLADICSADGTRFDKEAFHGHKLEYQEVPCRNWHCVYQQKPDGKTWALWRRALRMLSTAQRGNRLRLPQPLGDWTVPTSEMRRTWTYYLSPDRSNLHNRLTPEAFDVHAKLQYDYDGNSHAITHTLPPDAVPVQARGAGETFVVPTTCRRVRLSAPLPTPPSVLAAIHQMEPWERDLLQGLDLLVPEQELITALCESPLIFVSDGSADQDKNTGSFGWTLSRPNGQRLATCNGPVYTYKATSYRSEGYGILSVLRFVYNVLKLRNLASMPCHKLCCDNEKMVKRCQKLPKPHQMVPNSRVVAEWDLLAEVWETTRSIPEGSRPTINWIRGHQDKHTAYENLSLEAQLNVDADELAEAYVRTHPHKDYTTSHLFPTSGIQLHIQSGTATYQLQRVVTRTRPGKDLENYLCKKNEWSPQTLKDVDWEAHRRALNRHQPRRHTLVKHLHDYLPVGKRVHKYDPKYPQSCPSCAEPIETCAHVHQCPAQTRVQWRSTFLQTLRNKLESLNTAPPLASLLVEALHRVLHDEPLGDDLSTFGLPDLHLAQASIGWHHLLKGRFSKLWTRYQQTHLESLGVNSSQQGLKWTVNVIHCIFKSWLQLWDLRNEDRHGKDLEAKRAREKEQAQREVEALYDQQPRMPPCLQHLFHMSLQVMLQKSTSYLRAFINSFKPVIDKDYSEDLNTG